jgi:hypothetical protein
MQPLSANFIGKIAVTGAKYSHLENHDIANFVNL